MTDSQQATLHRYLSAFDKVESLHKQLSAANTDLRNAIIDMGKDFVPSDAKEDEPFNIWVDGQIFTITPHEHNNFTVCRRDVKSTTR
jgi:hypothetical protein